MQASITSLPLDFSGDDNQASDRAGSHAGETPCSLSLADIIARLQADPDLNLSQQREMISALHAVARLLDADPAAIAAEPRSLRNSLAALSPAAAGISRRRWNNIHSLMLAALQQARGAYHAGAVP
jgi:hypothetical protein